MCSPLRARADHTGAADGTTRISMTVGPDEPVLSGHYPGFPIFPGVCIIECLHRGALAAIPEPGHAWVLSDIEKARFMNPVFPGDSLTAELAWSSDGASRRCTASIAGERGTVAQITLRFAEGRGR